MIKRALASFLLAAPAWAGLGPPAYQVSFPTSSTYNVIQAVSSNAQEALIDLDGGYTDVAANAAAIASNTAAIAVNVSNIAVNVSNIAVNADALVTAVSAATSNQVSVGAIAPFAATNVPTGWLECDGSAVSRTTYSNLFAAVSTAHGPGNSSTTFNIPDLRGLFIRGWDHGASRDPDSGTRAYVVAGGATGDSVGSQQDELIETHQHSYNIPDGDGDNSSGLNDGDDRDGNVSTTSGTLDNETRPMNLYLMYCIKH
jgi:microcystin-dependent protein